MCMNALGIQAKFSTPYKPQGNTIVETYMRSLGKALKHLLNHVLALVSFEHHITTFQHTITIIRQILFVFQLNVTKH